MLKVLIVALASLWLASCASTSSGFLGVGGVSERVDTFTGKRVIETGEGFVYCPSSEGLLCDTRMTLRFLWAGGDSILIVAKLRDIKSIQAIQFNLGAEPITIRPAGTLTDFTSDVTRSGNTLYTKAESTQRFIITTEFARSLISSPKTLVRLELLNSNYNQPGDFLRPTVAGQPAAASLLTELLNRIDKTPAQSAP